MKRARPSTGSKPQKAKRRDPLDKLDDESGKAGVKDRSQEARASRLEELRRDGEAAILRAARLAGAKEKGGKAKR